MHSARQSAQHQGKQYDLRRRLLALQIAAVSLLLATLACTTNDNLFGVPFVRLTSTPTPTITPTPLAIDTKFRINDKATVATNSDFKALLSPPLPGPPRPGRPNSSCFPNTTLTILGVSKNTEDQSDSMIYYQVQCPGSDKGWLPELNLAHFAKGESPILKTKDGNGFKLLSSPNRESNPASEEPCPEGTSLYIERVTTNPTNDADPNIYFQVTCGIDTGFVPESVLVSAR